MNVLKGSQSFGAL